MDTNKKDATEILDFESFIKKYFISYQLNTHNTKLIRNLGLWATRNEKFNNPDLGWHIDRGILISGPVGAGKDEIFRILRKYLSYLRSPYGYGFKVVWEFAEPFQESGYSCFNEHTGNIYYEELALTDEVSGQPTREYVNHFGTKILIGSEIINIRYKVFKETAWQTHFSTNLAEDALEGVYGKRCMSRLYEMCNIMFLTGFDRRGKIVPAFLANRNTPKAPAPRETTIEEHEESRRLLEAEYQMFCEKGIVSETASLNYNILISYGCNLSTEDELRLDMELVDRTYSAPITPGIKSASSKEAERKAYNWKETRKLAVIKFYQRLKNGGAKTIFEIVDAKVGQLVNSAVKEIKGKA